MLWKYRLLVTVLVITLVSLQYRLWVGDGSLADVHQLQKQVDRQKQRVVELEARNAELAAEVSELKKGLDAVEARARSELGMIKEGETFYQIVDRPESND